jgi:hypothetical protein
MSYATNFGCTDHATLHRGGMGVKGFSIAADGGLGVRLRACLL